ncbi:MAG: crosslink repair DNA glycosylase YcaQ family protein [bacterium]
MTDRNPRRVISVDDLRRYALARSFFQPTTLGRAVTKLGFVQADPIRAPARAQDLILRHRVLGYKAGDLERAYSNLGLEEDFFLNYGFLPRRSQALMHPRIPRREWPTARSRQAQAVLAYITERGSVHPRDVERQFAYGKITNWFGGSSNAATHLLDEMHSRGLLRVVRREGGTRVYAVRQATSEDAKSSLSADDRFDALVDIAVRQYAPVPSPGLGRFASMVARAAPQWRLQRAAALARAKRRYARTRLDGIEWYWPANESPGSSRWQTPDVVRLLTPFDPVVWDRRRFRLFWDWDYRFEAYTPAAKRKLGYYAMPLLWRDQVIGWGNLSVTQDALEATFGYCAGRAPKQPGFRLALETELDAVRRFLGLSTSNQAKSGR